MARPGLNGSVVVSAPWKISSRLPAGSCEHDQVADLALLGERAGAARERHLVAFEIGGVGVERGCVRHLPAEEARRVAGVLVHHKALLLVVHAERGGAAALVHQLHAEEPAGVGRPVLQILGAKADIAEGLQAHRSSPARNNVLICRLYTTSRRRNGTPRYAQTA